jgi:DNA polymerase I-like protein with 3'-5' exonuclease and polymerase domains
MFFDDEPLTLKKKALLRELPPIPQTGWQRPEHPPDLSDAVAIGLDVETKENDFEHGPGWSRGQAHIVGASIAAVDRLGNSGQWYFPVRHEVEPEYNLNPAHVFPWLKRTLETRHIPKIGANLTYDIGNLTEEGIYVEGELHDIQFAEALIDDTGEVNLDYLAEKYGGTGKLTSELYEWCARAYGGAPGPSQRDNIWRAPARLVGPYAEVDASFPIKILPLQWNIMQQEGTLGVYRMECDLIPLMVRMRRAGVRIDVKMAEQLYVSLGNDIQLMNDELARQAGIRVNVMAPTDLARLFDHLGLRYNRTPTGKPSFQKEWLKAQTHPLVQLIVDIRELEKLRGTFVRGYLLERNVNGVIHCQFHQMRNDEGGAKTGRFSSSDPNLQNVSVRSKNGRLIRKAFIPDEGHKEWEKDDYSQVEYRMLAHYAVDKGDGSAEALRAAYNADPRTDYHDKVFRAYCQFTGQNYDAMSQDEKDEKRRPLKNVNFGLIYGQGEPSLAYKAGMSREQSKPFFAAYHQAAPYVIPTMEAIANEAKQLGYITTILGRRVRFELWEPHDNYDREAPALHYDAAIRAYGYGIERAYTYRAVNYKFQGSGTGDVIKAGMWKAHRDGVFDVIGVPRIQVHDELGFSAIDDTPQQNEAYAYMRRCLETTVPCRVPIYVDSKRGASWGDLK